MKSIITEELRARKRACDYALQINNNAEVARRSKTSAQQIPRWY